MALREPDELAIAARRWCARHSRPDDPVLLAVLRSLADYYDDLGVVVGIVRWRADRGIRSGEPLPASDAATATRIIRRYAREP